MDPVAVKRRRLERKSTDVVQSKEVDQLSVNLANVDQSSQLEEEQSTQEPNRSRRSQRLLERKTKDPKVVPDTPSTPIRKQRLAAAKKEPMIEAPPTIQYSPIELRAQKLTGSTDFEKLAEFVDFEIPYPDLTLQEAMEVFKPSDLNVMIRKEQLKSFAAFDPSFKINECKLFNCLSVIGFGDRYRSSVVRAVVASRIVHYNIKIGNHSSAELAAHVLSRSTVEMLTRVETFQLIADSLKVCVLVNSFHDFKNVTAQFLPRKDPSALAIRYMTIAVCDVQGITAFIIPTRPDIELNDLPITHLAQFEPENRLVLVNKCSEEKLSVFTPIKEENIRIEEVSELGLDKIIKVAPILVPIQVYLNPTRFYPLFAYWLDKFGAVLLELSQDDWIKLRPELNEFLLSQELPFRKMSVKLIPGTAIYQVGLLAEETLPYCEAQNRNGKPSFTMKTLISEILNFAGPKYYSFVDDDVLVRKYMPGTHHNSNVSDVFKTVSSQREIYGVITDQKLVSTPASVFPIHTENNEMTSVNRHVWGGSKVWFTQPSSSYPAVAKLMRSTLGEKFASCNNFVNHKQFFPHPQFLMDHGHSLYLFEQKEGMTMITAGNALHFGFNQDSNLAIAWNEVTEDWTSQYHKGSPCLIGHCTQIDKNDGVVTRGEDLLKYLHYYDKQNYEQYFNHPLPSYAIPMSVEDLLVEAKIPDFFDYMEHVRPGWRDIQDAATRMIDASDNGVELELETVQEGQLVPKHEVDFPDGSEEIPNTPVRDNTVAKRTGKRPYNMVNRARHHYHYDLETDHWVCEICSKFNRTCPNDTAIKGHVYRHFLKICPICLAPFRENRKLNRHRETRCDGLFSRSIPEDDLEKMYKGSFILDGQWCSL